MSIHILPCHTGGINRIRCLDFYVIHSGKKSMEVYKINEDMIMIEDLCTNTSYEVHIDSLYGITWLTPIIDAIHASTQLSPTYFDYEIV